MAIPAGYRMSRVAPRLRAAVVERAKGCCEYCRLPGQGGLFRHQADHIIAVRHGGQTSLDNLALACAHCNWFKGTDLTAIDPQTGDVIRIFNPRADRWSDHFRLEGPRILPLTPMGRATSKLLNFDDPEREQNRRELWLVGKYPG